jgi:hypothetical protein
MEFFFLNFFKEKLEMNTCVSLFAGKANSSNQLEDQTENENVGQILRSKTFWLI